MIDPKIKAKIQTEYEAGTLSIRKLEKKYGVSQHSIVNWASDDNWIKGKHEAKLKRSIAEKHWEGLAKAGLEKKHIYEQLSLGAKECNRTYAKGNGEDAFIEVEPDYKTRLEFIKEINKMTGSYEADKKEITQKTEISGFIESAEDDGENEQGEIISIAS